MSVHNNLDEYNKVREQLQRAEGGFIPIDPSKDLLEAFMGLHKFSISENEYNFEILLIDEVDQKIYAYPMVNRGDKQWVLELMCLIVKLRNIKKTWLEEKDSRKRRKIYSKMNYIKGELNVYR